jgi:DNA polymerase-1
MPAIIRGTQGKAVQGAYGFLANVLRAIKSYNPYAVYVCFDSESKNERHEMFEDYKGNRDISKYEDDRNPIMQLSYVYDCLNLLKIKYYEIEGVEGDDLVGSIARIAEQYGFNGLIVSSDSDFLQLVNETTFLVSKKGKSEIIYTTDEVYNRIGLFPSQIVDYKSLIGDKSDNIPGVRGIGEKTAIKLLREYGSIDSIFLHLNEIKGTVRDKLNNAEIILQRNKSIIKINTGVDIKLDFRKNSYRDASVRELFRELKIF